MSCRAARELEVLILYDCIYPLSLGGVEHRNFELAKVLARRGHRITLAGFSPAPSTPAEGVRVLPIGPPGQLYTASGRRSTRESLRLAKGVARLPLGRYDVIETANIPYVHLLPLAARCRLLGKPLLVTWHEYWGTYWRHYQGPVKWLPYAAMEWLTAQLGTRATAVSRLTGGRLQARRLGAQEVEVVPNGIEIDTIRRSASQAQREGPPLVYAGRLVVEKRLDLLLRATQRLAGRVASSSRDGLILTVIGDGPDRARLSDLAAELGITDRVEFLGRLKNNQEVWRRLGEARIAVQPSSREGFGLFPLEAMATGLPVVYCESSESALNELVVDGLQGVAVPPDAEALSTCLERLLNDKPTWQKLSENARERAEGYGRDQVAERFEAILLELCSGTR